MRVSPSGKRVVESSGPRDARIVFIGESPARKELELGAPLVGPSGQMFNKALSYAGIDRSKCYVMNLVPVRAPGDKFAQHDPVDIAWGREVFKQELAQLTNAKVFVPMGANPTEWLLGGKPPVADYSGGKREGFIGAWRGSVLPVTRGLGARPEDYLDRLQRPIAELRDGACVIPTFHPSAVLRQFSWHTWFLLDIQKVATVAKDGPPPVKYRTWYRDDLDALKRLADEDVGLIAVDTELSPQLVALVTDTEVHVFEWGEKYRKALTKILENPKILKVAHRWLHDYAFIRKRLEIDTARPIFDSVGGAFALNTSDQKELSPHISTKFTNWPYHKWLSAVDQWLYCGMDSIVCYDSYWPMVTQAMQKGLMKPVGEPGILDHDHKVFYPLLQMQAKGFRIDEVERLKVAEDLQKQLDAEVAELQTMVEPIVEARLKAFEKPHLFRVLRKCECCGGGNTQRNHCPTCHVKGCDCLNTPEGTKVEATVHQFKTIKEWKASWPVCEICNGTGKITKKLPFNSDSPDQLADVVYRGLKIRARKYKGNETVKAAQLNDIKSRHPIIEKIVGVSALRSDCDTVNRLRAGADGCLHCEFDPWGTGSGRVASKEGLIEPGTNAQNLPKDARRFVVPREGYRFIYPDMAQIEARNYAVISGDKNLKKALYEVLPDLGKPDYHTWLLRAIHDYDPRISLSRDQSKRTSYAGMFGVSPEQLAKELTAEAFRKKEGQQVDVKMATAILETLYRVCPDIRRIQQEMCDTVLSSKRLKNPYTGREFTWTNRVTDVKQKGELLHDVKKQVYSRFVQDMACYVVGLGLIDMYYTPNVWGHLLNPLVHVHDALLIEVPENNVEEAETLAVSMMTRRIWSMDYPAEVKKGKEGTNWYNVS